MSDLGLKIINAVRELVDENPDFVYEPKKTRPLGATCRYVHNGRPSCLIGQALWRLSLIDATVEFKDWNECDVERAIEELGLRPLLDDDELHWLSAVQNFQDTNRRWRDCVVKADRLYRRGLNGGDEN